MNNYCLNTRSTKRCRSERHNGVSNKQPPKGQLNRNNKLKPSQNDKEEVKSDGQIQQVDAEQIRGTQRARNNSSVPPMFKKGSYIAFKDPNDHPETFKIGLLLEDFRDGEDEAMVDVFSERAALPFAKCAAKVPIVKNSILSTVSVTEDAQNTKGSKPLLRITQQQYSNILQKSVHNQDSSCSDDDDDVVLSSEQPLEVEKELSTKNRRQLKQAVKHMMSRDQSVQASYKDQGTQVSMRPPPKPKVPKVSKVAQQVEEPENAPVETQVIPQNEDIVMIDTSTAPMIEGDALVGTKRPREVGEFNSDGPAEMGSPEKKLKAEPAKKKVNEKLPEFKKGKCNPFIELLDADKYKEGTSDQLFTHCCVRCNNKNVIRAAITGNRQLLMAGISAKEQISQLTAPWSAEVNWTALEYAIIKNQHEIIDLLFQPGNALFTDRVLNPIYLLNVVDTGQVSNMAYGFRAAPVQMTRGNRQGNNAFLEYKDNKERSPFKYANEEVFLKRILQSQDVSIKTYIQLIDLNSGIEAMIASNIYEAVRAGNQKIAYEVFTHYTSQNSFGSSVVHCNMLSDDPVFDKLDQQSAVQQAKNNRKIAPIHCACINPNPKYLQALIDKGASTNVSDSDQRRPVHYAAACTGPEPLKLLIVQGVNLLDLDNEQKTCLHLAAITGRAHNINTILQRNSSMIGLKDSKGMTAIAYACKYGHIEAVDVLLEYRASLIVGVGAAKMTPLLWASTYGHFDLTQYLLDKKARVLSKDNFGRTALIMAVRNGHTRIASLLLQKGSEWNHNDSSMNTPLHYAAAYGWLDCIDLLLKAGADVNAQNSWKISPINTAMMNNHHGCVKRFLVEPYVDVNVKDEKGRTLVMLSLLIIDHDSYDFILFLIKKGANLNIQDLDGQTALHHIAKYVPKTYDENGKASTVNDKRQILIIKQIAQLFVSSGADLSVKDHSGKTAFNLCFEMDNAPILEVLIDKVSLNKEPDLFFALKDRIFNIAYQKVLETLISNDPPSHSIINYLDDEGFTPFLSYTQSFTKNHDQLFATVSNMINQQSFTHGKKHELYNVSNTDIFDKFADKQKYFDKNPNFKDEEKLELANKFFNSCIVTPFVDFLRFMISKGADAHASVQKLKVFRDLEAKSEAENRSSLEQEDVVMINTETVQLPPIKVEDKGAKQYCNDGLKNAVNFIVVKPQNLLIDFLIEQRVNPDQPDYENITPFNFLITRFDGVLNPQQIYAFEMILKQGVKIDSLDKKGSTPFLYLYERSNYELAFKILDFGANVNFQDPNGQYALRYALQRQQKVQMEKLIERGASVNLLDKEGQNLLHYASSQMKTVSLSKEALNVLKVLTDQFGVQIRKRDYIRRLMVYHVIKSIKLAIEDAPFFYIQFLIERGIHINQVDNVNRRNVMHLVFEKMKADKADITLRFMKSLLDSGADINSVDSEGRSVLHLAIASKKEATLVTAQKYVEFLLDHGADINQFDNQGQSVLHLLIDIMKGVMTDTTISFVAYLLTKGASINQTDVRGRNILHLVVEQMAGQSANNNLKMIQLLVDRGVNINQQDVDMRTPLHYFFINFKNKLHPGNIDPFQPVMALCGCKHLEVDVSDKYLKTPLHYASQKGSSISASYLIHRGGDLEKLNIYGNTALGVAMLNLQYNFAIQLIHKGSSVHSLSYQEILLDQIWDEEEALKGLAEKIKALEYKISIEDVEMVEEKPVQQSLMKAVVAKELTDKQKLIELNKNYKTKERLIENLKLDFKNREGVSLFKMVSRGKQQGLAYLILEKGYALRQALQEAMDEMDFELILTLLSVIPSEIVTEAKGQNLFHMLSMKAAKCTLDQLTKLYTALKERGVDCGAKDSFGRTALHYAVMGGSLSFVKMLLTQATERFSPNEPDYENKTPLSMCIEGGKSISTKFYQEQVVEEVKAIVPQQTGLLGTLFPQKPIIPLLAAAPPKAIVQQESILLLLIEYGGNLNKPYPESAFTSVYPSPLQRYHGAYNSQFLSTPIITLLNINPPIATLRSNLLGLLHYGARLNAVDSDGRDAVMHAIILNRIEVLSLIFEQKGAKDPNLQDRGGKSAAHYVVNPLKYGSYENVEILRLLHKQGYNLNLKDANGNTPQYYASLQQSGVMSKEFRSLLNEQFEDFLPSQTECVSWPEQTVDYTNDAQLYVQNASKDQNIITKTIPVDETGKFESSYIVFMDDNGKAWDAYCTKVNLNNGIYGEYVFYKMQLLYETNRDLYIVFTRWGRIGEDGMNQRTPFNKLRDAKDEFKKIFSEKTGGNNFEDLSAFEKVKKKYNITKVNYHTSNVKDHLEPFNCDLAPASQLSKPLQELFGQIANVTMYQRALTHFGVNNDALPFSGVNKPTLLNARQILFDTYELIKEDNALSRQGVNADFERLIVVKESIAELSGRYYELIPLTKYQNCIPPPFNSIQDMQEQYDLIENLLNFEYTSRILLGALQRQAVMNPVDYVYNALNLKINPLSERCPEYAIVRNYIEKTNSNGLSNIQEIFELQRKGEAEMIDKFRDAPNHYLLFHGSSMTNFIGILSQGLKIAPREAPTSGYMFGKGVYFADMFDKSFGYAQRGNDPQQNGYLMLMCEVALGESKNLEYPEYVEALDDQFLSVKGCGMSGPDDKQTITLPNGLKVPQGAAVPQGQGKSLAHNEFIVYNKQQIRMRYLIYIKKTEKLVSPF